MKPIFLFLLLIPQISFSADAPAFPASSTRKAIVHELAREMARVDGEGLIVREGRPSSFEQIAESLALEAERAEAWPDFLLALKRLDQAYPNLHAYLDAGSSLPTRKRISPTVGFTGEWLAGGKTQHRISRVDPQPFPQVDVPQVGDLLVGINGKPIEEWRREHFDYCKWALREQCDLQFTGDFYNEFSGWTRKEPLTYQLQRGNRTWSVAVPLKDRGPSGRDESRLLCANFPNRYVGFHLVHGGKFACFFEKDNDPSTVILRITSFQYHRSSNHEGVNSPREEVDAFLPYWSRMAHEITRLIIDLSDNGGGNETTPYYAVFFDKPYQEQWVRMKKIPELENDLLRDSIFWGTDAQEIWFQNLRKEGIWDSTPYGGFLPPVPMFCALPGQDCRLGRHPVRNPGFAGKVSLIVNKDCVSSCDGFAYAFKQELGDRVTVVGQPQAADSAYSRIRIGLELGESLPNGFRLLMLPQYDDLPPGIILSQIATVTRSVTEEGEVVSGKPLHVDRFVPITLEREGNWHMDALIEALR